MIRITRSIFLKLWIQISKYSYVSNIFRMVWVWCQRCTHTYCNLYLLYINVVGSTNESESIVKFQYCWHIYWKFHKCLWIAKKWFTADLWSEPYVWTTYRETNIEAMEHCLAFEVHDSFSYGNDIMSDRIHRKGANTKRDP